MRDYAKVSPQFWTGQTGRQIRALGRNAQLIAMYVMTCPSANMLGLFYLPMPTLCHETGIDPEGASKALRSLSEVAFLFYDESEDTVFVPEMARYQIGDRLAATDNRVKAVRRELENYRKSRFFKDFVARYAERYHLDDVPNRASPFEAPSKPLRSQEQEQEQEQEEYRAAHSAAAADVEAPVTEQKAVKPEYPPGLLRFWNALPAKAKDRSSSAKCLPLWKKLKLESNVDEVITSLEQWKRCQEWRREDGQYVPGAHRWLKDRKFEQVPGTDPAARQAPLNTAIAIRA